MYVECHKLEEIIAQASLIDSLTLSVSKSAAL